MSAKDGARNLLASCAGLAPGDAVLIVAEDEELGWYEAAAAEIVADEARRMGLSATLMTTRALTPGTDAVLDSAVQAADAVVYFARIGDRDRFDARTDDRTVVMSYVSRADGLTTPFATTPHPAMAALKDAVDAVTFAAREIAVTCPLGTALAGTPGPQPLAGDVSVRRFPLAVPMPVPADAFSGIVTLSTALAPTGSRLYEPAALELPRPVHATVRAGRLTALDGSAEDVAAVRAHIDHVAGLFDLDGAAIHSFHAGLSPAADTPFPAASDYDRWANTIFPHPRLLHFHTCGAEPPGEICWMVVDPTVTLDGVALWDRGRLHPERFEATRRCLDEWPALTALYAAPPGRIGL